MRQPAGLLLHVHLFGPIDVVPDFHRFENDDWAGTEVDDAVGIVGAGQKIRVLVPVHVHPAGQREAERAQIGRHLLRVNHLRRLGADTFAGPVEDVDGAFPTRPVVRRPDGQIVESVQIDVAQLGDGQSESGSRHLAVALQDVA